MASQSLPPDQSWRKYEKNQRLIFLSVAENGVEIGRGTGYPSFETTSDQEHPIDYSRGVYIYAEKVVATQVSAPNGGLSVATWQLDHLDIPDRTGKEKNTDKLKLDTSGKGGKKGNAGMPNGTNGRDAHTLSLYVQNLDDDAAKKLVLLARGGQGGGGNSLQDKDGDGGRGGTIVSILQPTYRRVLDTIRVYLGREEFDATQKPHWDTTIITKKDDLFVAASTLLSAREDLAVSEGVSTEIFGKLCTAVEESTTVADLRGGANYADFTLSNLVKEQANSAALSPDLFRGGYAGTGGDGTGRNGANGHLSYSFNPSMDKIVTAPFPFAHPVQCTMLLERADIYFCVNSEHARSHAERLYQRLVERLDFLQLLPSGPLKTAYKQYEQDEIMPKGSLQRLADIQDSARARLRSLRSGISDFYGHAERWVPRENYTEYKTELDRALAEFESFEEAYISYHSPLEAQNELKDKVKLVSERASRAVGWIDEDKDRILQKLHGLDLKIAAKKSVVETAERELQIAYANEGSNIQESFGLSIPKIVNAMKDVVLFPGKGIAAFEVGDLLIQGLTTVPKIDGGTVTEEYLASEFKKSRAKITSLSFELKRKSDGTYPLDEENRRRLVVAKDDMIRELNSFSHNALGGVNDAVTRKKLEDCFDAYINEVTDRNNLILRYNLLVKRIEDLIKAQAKYEAEAHNIKGRLDAQNDPDLPTIANHIGTIYQLSRSRVMRLLDILLRALRFRTLGSHPFLDFTPNSSKLEEVPLSLNTTELKNARSKIEELFQQRHEGWSSEPSHFQSDFSAIRGKRNNLQGGENQGKRYHLREEDWKKLIAKRSVSTVQRPSVEFAHKRLEKVTLSIPPALRDSQDAGDFTRCCNVRIHQVRFWFYGLRTAKGTKRRNGARVNVTMTHDGNETIVSREEATEFEHDPIKAIFSFYLYHDGSASQVDDGNIYVHDVNETTSTFAPPGPFAKWTISIGDGTEFDKLDFTRVEDAYFDFCGTNYAL